MPEFAEFYAQFGHGAELPLSTRIVVAISTNLVGSAGLIFGGAGRGDRRRHVLWFRQPAQRRRLHAAILRLPYFGPLARKLATAQVVAHAGDAARRAASRSSTRSTSRRESVGNQSIADELCGRGASRCARAAAWRRRWPSSDMFPHVAVEMVEVGESTGALADMLNSVADFYDEENETSLTRFSNLIQPVLLIVMGFVIAGLLLSLYMPLFNLSSLTS